MLDDFLQICKGITNQKGILINSLYNQYRLWFDSFEKGESTFTNYLQGMLDYQLSKEQAVLVLGYTGTFSQWINYDLRNGNKTSNKCKSLYIDNLTSTLDKIPSYNSSTVFRMDNGSTLNPQTIFIFTQIIGLLHLITHF